MPEFLIIDEEKLQTVIAKLLDNAIKFTSSGFVRCSFQCDKSRSPWQLICEVEDSGIGMSPAEIHNIFQAFQQAEGGFKRRFGGLGIGMNICKKLVQVMHGQLSITSTEGKGSYFTVIFPVFSGTPPANQQQHIIVTDNNPILVVEDNPVNQKVMVKLLEKLGYPAIVAENGQQALDFIESQNFSVILMDLQMPIMDGFTCCERIRQRQDSVKDIPIIAVTANLMDIDKEHCTNAGMNDFLKKPIRLETLHSSLRQYIHTNKIFNKNKQL